MEDIGGILRRIMESASKRTGLPIEAFKCDLRTPLEWSRRKADQYNAERGKLHLEDGYDCPLCLNRGDSMGVRGGEGEGEMVYEYLTPCACMETRRSLARIRASGLGEAVERLTFESFRAEEPWQRAMLDTALRYVGDAAPRGGAGGTAGRAEGSTVHPAGGSAGRAEGSTVHPAGGSAGRAEGSTVHPIEGAVSRSAEGPMAQRPRAAWLFYGGAVGSGKTHICTAVSRELMRGGLRLRYMLWTEEVARLKGLIGEEGYEEELRFYRTAPALYIDDFFKPVRDLAGVVQPPSAADVRLAYDIVNARYLRPELRTIFSSERWLSEIIALDEAVGSRIAERARDFIVEVARMPGRNRRYA